jgi:hypothetical protein
MNQYYVDQERYFWRISKNAAKCLSCGDVLESKYRHDFMTCSCGCVSVDGGMDYIKRCGSFNNIEELTESRRFSETELNSYIDEYTRQMRTNKIYSEAYYLTTINAAKYFRELWYNQSMV